MAKSKGRVLVAMSGGVDSSVTAYLLQSQGYECIGATMKLYNNDAINNDGHTCCSLDDVEDARDVAFRLGIPHYVFDYSAEFEDEVMRPFVEEYEAGHTPNPCIECNRRMKFSRLLQRAEELGCDFIATGHYARIERVGEDASSAASVDDGSDSWARDYAPASDDVRFELRRGLDATKDQSYVLSFMTQDQLAHTLLPLGGFTKAHVREIAEQQGFINAQNTTAKIYASCPMATIWAFWSATAARRTSRARSSMLKARCLASIRAPLLIPLGSARGSASEALPSLILCWARIWPPTR